MYNYLTQRTSFWIVILSHVLRSQVNNEYQGVPLPMKEQEKEWYFLQIEQLDPDKKVVTIDKSNNLLTYSDVIKCDESHIKAATGEEVVRALVMCLLLNSEYKYSIESLYIEKYYQHGHPTSKRDEVDILIFDSDHLPFAMWELKSAKEYDKDPDKFIKSQLFGTAPLVGAPKLLVYATIKPSGEKPTLTAICIDYIKYKTYDSWVSNERPLSNIFPESYIDLAYQPLVQGGKLDLKLDCNQADFRTAAATFHAEFFSEHPDNVLFTNLMKCLLAKICDERQTKKGQAYNFQVFYKEGKEESAVEVFTRINDLYKIAYSRYIEPGKAEPDEINPNEFSRERLKTIVKVLQVMSITRGAALNADVIGAFFEEILRTGFKQDKGMYFTHANLVWFILEAIDLAGLAITTWEGANHPENRLPYVIDPACGSGTFLLRAMHIITDAIRSQRNKIVTDYESIQFFNARMSDEMPNYWAEHFLYGMDPKFVMAITAKINMVLHGDGSAHIFKYDALKPFSSYSDDKLKPLSDKYRSIPRTRYDHDMVETFDVVVSNPPFGITLSSDTKTMLPDTFSLNHGIRSEMAFLERWFQLLKPKGRLGVVVPESLLNTAEAVAARLFLYRTFWIRAIVALPRNLFIETPTLTSLLFAQKKTSEAIKEWDDLWEKISSSTHQQMENMNIFLRKAKTEAITPDNIQRKIIGDLANIIGKQTYFTRRGKSPISCVLPKEVASSLEACSYYGEMLRAHGFNQIIRNFIFGEVCKKFDYAYPVYIVDETGYKLSKRKERIRPNQLCRFVDSVTDKENPNLHLADGSVKVVVDSDNPERILDFLRRDVKWY